MAPESEKPGEAAPVDSHRDLVAGADALFSEYDAHGISPAAAGHGLLKQADDGPKIRRALLHPLRENAQHMEGADSIYVAA